MEDKNLEIYMDEESLSVIDVSHPENYWWTPNNILSYNCLYNFIIGNRGSGKTFGSKAFCVRQAIYNGEEFVYLRRTDVELKKAAPAFFNDLVKENKFPGYAFRHRNGEFQCIESDENGEPYDDASWQTIGYSAYLSGGRTMKSVSYPNVKWIIFDEFIVPGDRINMYLPDEVTVFLEFYETVARMRDVRVLFLANALTTVNPYFIYFDLHVPYGKSIGRMKQDIVFELINNPEYIAKKKETRFGKLVAGTKYEKYAIENKFVYEHHDDIQKLDKSFSYWITLIWKDHWLGVYRSDERQQYVISPKVDIQYPTKINLQLKDGRINKMMISQLAKYYHLDVLYSLFQKGYIYYENKKTKGICYEMWKKLM